LQVIANTLTIARAMGKFGAPAPLWWIGLGVDLLVDGGYPAV
jgi:hypothetical protein